MTSMYLKYILLINIICISFGDVYGQSITWQRMYDSGAFDDVGRDVCEDGKGNFYISGGKGGYFYLMKINAYGVKLWDRYIEYNISFAMAIASSGDGGCVVTGSNDSAYAIKFDSLGNVIWWKNYSYGSYTAYDIDKTSDGGYIICGNMIQTYTVGMVYKIDSFGNLKWFKTYSSALYCRLFDILETNDKKYFMTGYYDANPLQGYLLRIDSSGNYLWDKKFLINGQETILRSINAIGNRFIISGQIGGPPRWYPNIIKINTSGDILFNWSYTNDTNAYNPMLKIINPNKYVIAYSTATMPGFISNGKIIITDSTGNINISKVFLSAGYMYLENVLNLPNGDIIAVGSNEFDTTNNRDIYAVRTDSNLYAPPIGIKENNNTINSFQLHQNYPNPFNPVTTIKYYIPKAGLIEFKIYDVQGKEIFYYSGYKHIGEYEYKFDASNLSSGVYFYQLKATDYIITRKMVLLK